MALIFGGFAPEAHKMQPNSARESPACPLGLDHAYRPFQPAAPDCHRPPRFRSRLLRQAATVMRCELLA